MAEETAVAAEREKGLEQLVSAVKDLTVIIDRLENRSGQTVATQQNALDNLQVTLKEITVQVQQITREAQSQIQQQTKTTMTEALDDSLEHAQQILRRGLTDYEQRLAQITLKLIHTVDELTQANQQLTKHSRWMFGKAFSVLLMIMLALLAFSGVQLWQLEQRIERVQVEEEVQQALQHVRITSCGGEPCIQVNQDTPRWGKNQEYVLVRKSP